MTLGRVDLGRILRIPGSHAVVVRCPTRARMGRRIAAARGTGMRRRQSWRRVLRVPLVHSQSRSALLSSLRFPEDPDDRLGSPPRWTSPSSLGSQAPASGVVAPPDRETD